MKTKKSWARNVLYNVAARLARECGTRPPTDRLAGQASGWREKCEHFSLTSMDFFPCRLPAYSCPFSTRGHFSISFLVCSVVNALCNPPHTRRKHVFSNQFELLYKDVPFFWTKDGLSTKVIGFLIDQQKSFVTIC